MCTKWLYLAFAGACGTLVRYALYEATHKLFNSALPIGTLIVNVSGTFLFGLIFAIAKRKLHLNDEITTIVLIGFIGSFTTFSAFAYEAANMLKSAQWLLTCGYITGMILLGVVALVLGVLAGRIVCT